MMAGVFIYDLEQCWLAMGHSFACQWFGAATKHGSDFKLSLPGVCTEFLCVYL
jgi:hypothetical protein